MLQQDEVPSQLLLADSSPGASDSPLACPFYKFNLDLYDMCGEFRFFEIPDVKQHLVHFHSQEKLPAFSCTVCHSPVVDEPSKMLHLRDGSCRIVAAQEKLSPQEVIELIKTESTQETSAERQWSAIWNQLFPGHPEPPTPYKKSNNIEEVMVLFMPHLKREFRAAYPTLYDELCPSTSSFEEVMADAYFRYRDSLPVSRQGPSVDRSSRDKQNAERLHRLRTT